MLLLAARLAALSFRWSSPAGGRQGNPCGAGVPPGLDRRRRGGAARRLLLKGPREELWGGSSALYRGSSGGLPEGPRTCIVAL
jgi:hypothetical protein